MPVTLSEDKIDEMIYAHSQWKLRLKGAIQTRKSEFTVEKVRDCHACVFGQFLDSAEGQQMANHATISQLHQAFHVEAAEIMQLALSGSTEQAQARMESGSEFMQLTTKLVNHLADLKYQAN